MYMLSLSTQAHLYSQQVTDTVLYEYCIMIYMYCTVFIHVLLLVLYIMIYYYSYCHVLCVDIRIDWRVFNYKPDDDKLIDLISYIGQPFPKLSANNDSEAVVDNETRPLVRAIIQPHEGVWSNGYPFTIEPQQMVRAHYVMNE